MQRRGAFIRGMSIAALGLLATSCNVTPRGTPLEHGQWQISSTFGTPKVDGESIDELRKSLPADTASTECMTPYIRTGNDVMTYFNIRQDKCEMTSATSDKGVIHGEGNCAGVARMLGGSGEKDAWVKFDGTYNPRFIDISADFTITLKSPRGETERATFSASHKAERIGDCP